MRRKTGLPALRKNGLAPVVIGAIDAAKERLGCRIVHFCAMDDHVHLIAEAPDRDALPSAMNGLGVRIARRVNGALGRRGAVFSDRYHAHHLRSLQEVYHAVRYGLLNARKHGIRLARNALDA